MDKRVRFHLWYIVAALMGVLLLQALWTQSQKVEEIPYSQFQELLKSRQVQEVSVGANAIYGTLKPTALGEQRQFVTNRVDPALALDLQQYGVRYGGWSRIRSCATYSPGSSLCSCFSSCGWWCSAALWTNRDSAAS